MASKRYKSLPKDTKKIKAESINKLISVVKKNCTSKFEESIDINFQINVKQKKGEVNLRAMVNLPVGTGKKIKVAVVCEDTKLDEAKKTSADIVGSEDLIEKISLGKIDFDKLISTPAMMIKLSKLGKLLGPKGLMPNPKLGTVTANIPEAVKLIKSGQVEIKNDKDGNIGTSIGKKNFSDQNLINNFNSIIEVISKEKPSNVKGQLIKSAFITSTMGVSYKLKLDKNI
jgi:large subunit ribosomal protein L1